MLRHRLLVSDLDGTLLDEFQEVSAVNAHAIERFQAAGGTLVLATGRIEGAVTRFCHDLSLSGPAILYNGARVVDLPSGVVLREWPMNVAAGEIATFVAAADEHTAAVVFGPDRAVAVSGSSPIADATIAEYAAKDRLAIERWSGRADDPAPLLKVLFITPPGVADELAALAAAAFADVAVVRSEHNYVELVAAGVSKGSALAWLLDHLGLGADQVVAVGDQLNDRELLVAAGVGAAVGDGHPALRDVADEVVATRDEGAVADAVAIALGEWRGRIAVADTGAADA